ncbi:TPA: hypothetical protein LLB39_002264 [Enterococcus faecium]|uniref:hypothetical protein n=1 Tax=Enterococcus TaxID=1350 RepID=UPI0001EB7ABB|nr:MULTISPECIES: hypothetical protein [Enterococcus]AOM20722.1 hypothetical protein AL015_15575 [Enterococcus faecium]AOM32741.1 hypothetical protein AL020_15255 [Enterococcus faecium]AOM35735.1 hypothetical protein AL021_15035 [Enterococcus faecium]AOM39057.1 hypothetical protein AL024_15385 [Enterococcus faecium]EFR69499.1 hypothetical protein HMPREF9524_00345 [Enterococcus faecium TX0133a01]
MAVNRKLQVLITDDFGGSEWFDVQSIDFEEEVVVIENVYGEEYSYSLEGENVEDLRLIGE